MAKTITIGHASSSGNNGGKVDVGDQGQVKTPDYLGEVCMRERTIAEFNSYYGNGSWKVIRPKDPAVASQMAELMITACNNANIGYVYGGHGMKCQGGTHSVNTKQKCGTDCSGLVSECISEAMGIKFYHYTGDLVSSCEALQVDGKRAFFGAFTFKSFSTKEVYNGDVMVIHQTSGQQHTCIVVKGNPRDGQEDEDPGTTSGSGEYDSIGNTLNSYATGVRLNAELEYSFVPRTKKPTSSDEGYKYYTAAKDGKYGKNATGQYAWARFSEVCKSHCSLDKGAMRGWFNKKEDGYQRSTAPSLGAVMCFTNIQDTSDPGFACIVEVVHSQYIYVSYTTSGGSFKYVKRVQTDGSWNWDMNNDGVAEYVFQGFIYPPNIAMGQGLSDSSALSRFISCAHKHDGSGAEFTKNYTGFKTSSTSSNWSCAYVNAVAKEAGGILDVVIPDTCSCTTLARTGVQRNLGQWYRGPALKGQPTPQIGDIAFFRTVVATRTNEYECDRVGIVVDVGTYSKDNAKGAGSKGSTIPFTVMTVINGTVNSKEYTNTSNQLSGIFRPYWSKIDGTAEIVKWVTSPIGMYNEGTTIEDAALRDIAYAESSKNKYEPSIKKTGITLSALNYTGLLSNMYSVLAEIRASADDDTTTLPTLWNNTTLSEYLLDIYATEPFPPYNQSLPGSGGGGLDDDSSDSSGDIIYADIASSGVIKNKNGSKVHTTKGDMPLNGNSRAIFDGLYNNLKNRASVCGVMANMWQESGFNIGAVNRKADGTSDGGSGLIQWTFGRCDAMKKFCRTHGTKEEWNHNLTGQLEYLFYECKTNSHYKEGWQKLKKVPDTKAGAEEAAVIFLKYLELGQGQWGSKLDLDNQALRKPFAAAAWKLFIGE